MRPDKHLPGFRQTVQWFCVGDMMRKILLAAVVVAGALAPGLALADAREDVVSSLTRCAALTDDRQ
jgi:hypothetical protein